MTDEALDVRAVRARMHLTQEAFAARFGLTVTVVRDWEQRRRQPSSVAKTLLRVIERAPDAVEAALAA